MKKRLLSIFLCFCICIGLIPVSVFAREASDPLITQYGDGAPASSYKGHVLQLTEEADQGAGKFYSVRVGIQNIGESNIFILNLKYNTSKLMYCDETGEDYEGEAGASDAIVVEKVTDDMFKDAASDANKNTYRGTLLSQDIFGSPIITTEGKDEGCVSIALATSDTNYGAKLKATFAGLSSTGNNTYTVPANKTIWLYKVYLKPIDGATIERDDIGLYSDSETDYAGATGGNGAKVFVDPGVYFQGWPEAAPEYGTVKINTGVDASTPLGGVPVTLTPSSKASGEPISGATSSNEADFGSLTLTDVPTGDYTLSIARDATGKTKDGRTYKLTSAYNNAVKVEKDQTVERAIQSGFEELHEKYAFTVKAVNASGEDVTLTSSALNSTNVSIDAEGTAAAGQLAVSTAVAGDNELTLQGLEGYQPKTVTLKITGSSNVISKIECDDAAVSVDGTAVTITVPKTTTNVVVPLPVPTDPDTNEPITEEQAKKMEVTFTPKTEEAKAELGENIKVPVEVTTGSDGQLTITVSGDLPDGAYSMTIGGEGYNPTTLDVTVITTPDGKHVVNIGGTPEIGEDGEVSGVTGGVTGSSTGDSTGNGKVDLTGGDSTTDIVEGGSIDNTDPENPKLPSTGDDGVKDVEGGLLDSETAKDPDGMGGELTPSVDTDPTYEVVLKLDDTAFNSATKIIAEVYLKNLGGQNGTFGMYYDPKFFDTPTGVTLNPAISNLDFGDFANGTSSPVITSSYLTFNWNITAGGDVLSGNPLLATIELPLNSTYKNQNDKLLADIDNRSVYTQDFAKTTPGQDIVDSADGDQAILNSMLGAAWRYITNKDLWDEENGKLGWPAGHAEFLADSKSTRDGFYQVYDVEAIAHDVRMVFKPEYEIKNFRADFWVTEPEDARGEPGADIKNATIYISNDEDVISAITLEEWAAMTQTKAEALGMTVLTTDNFGNANAAQKAGTYYFVVMEEGHWTYPDGKAGNEQDPLYASYTLSETGIASAGAHTTNVLEGYLNPQMASKTFHDVALEPKDSGEENVTINSAETAYNTVDYYFSLTPKAGYDWVVSSMEDLISATDPKLTATLYDAKYTASPEAADFRDGGTAVTIEWDAVREMFKISGDQIKGDGIGANGTLGYDPLRAGDLVLTLDTSTDVVDKAEYTITATAGVGGKVSFALNDTDPGDVYDSNYDSATAGDPYQGLVEVMAKGSTTSSTFTFTPDGTNKIGKVIINGVEQTLTDAQKESTYTYQFINVSSDQTIYATFVDEEGNELSDPYITVDVGSHGGVTVTADKKGTDGSSTAINPNPFDPDALTGPQTQVYNVPIDPSVGDGEKEVMKIEVTPDEGYEIDTILVGDNVLPKPDGYDPTTGWTGETVEIELADGLTESVVITFKPIGEPSIQAIVVSQVKAGFGSLTVYGQKIYAVGERPTYNMTPAEHWTLNVKKDSVLLDGADKSTDVNYDGKVNTDTFITKPATYQLPALGGGVTKLDVTFFEQAVTVNGLVRITADVAAGKKVAKAHLKFVRKADAENQTDATTVEVDSEELAATCAESGFMQLAFTANIPAGTWQVTVTKQGYLTYIIDEFTVAADATYDIYFGDPASDGKSEITTPNMKPIPLLIGDAAGGGVAVALDDAAMVSSGWLSSNKNLAKRIKADLDENTYSAYLEGTGTADQVKSGVSDMTKVKNNINQKRTKTTYNTFSGIVSP